jgi:hypothetical protein
MGPYIKFLKSTLFIFLAAFILSACSGGGGGPTTTVNVQTNVVQGIAAAGTPINGVVYLSDSQFLNFSTATSKKPITTPINQDGTFSIDVSSLKAPFILRAIDTFGNILYSFAKAPGTTNINPLTNLAVAIAAGATDMQDLDSLFINHNSSNMLNIANTITQINANINSSLKPLLTLYGAESADPFSGTYQDNKQGLDGLFDDVSFSISGGIVTIVRNDTNTTVFSSPIGMLSSSANSAGLDTNNLPTPTSYPMPGNSLLTLKLNGALPQGTLVKYIFFSVQLPLGVNVDLDPTDNTGLTSAVNTAIPIGTAEGANVYPAPTLSSTNNILNISISSLAGFNTGNFLTIRLIASSPSLFPSTTAASFTITASNMYGDIYRNQLLQGLTIVPVSFLYPID